MPDVSDNPRTTARVRVFVPTYRRAHLLERALRSLLSQTFADWVCEIHNDDPLDPVPEQLVRSLNDRRITLCTHERNLGTVATFDLFYRSTPEPFYSLLEDDNWWDPNFLDVMLEAMGRHPEVVLAWCNQSVWREAEDGSWHDTGTFTQPIAGSQEARLIEWGHPRQALGALHANGSMLLRSRQGERFPTVGVPQAGVEPFRERAMPHPLLYVPRPLAYFAMTRQSSRPADPSAWSGFQVLLLAAYVECGRLTPVDLRILWRHYSTETPAPTNVFLFAGLLWASCRPFLRLARWPDWWRLARHVLGHPFGALRVIRACLRPPMWWDELNRNTSARFAERRRPSSLPSVAVP